MTGLEMLGISAGFATLYDMNQKHHWSDTALNTINKPAEEWSFKQLILVLLLVVLLTLIWFNILQGYIWE